MDGGKKKEKPKHPRATASKLSALTFIWTWKLFRMGRKRDLEIEDLYQPLKEHTSTLLGDSIDKAWQEECSRAAAKKRGPSLLRVLCGLIGHYIILYGLVMVFTETMIKLVQPLFLAKLLQYFLHENGPVSKDEAYLYALGIFLCSALSVIIVHPQAFGLLHVGMKMRISCCSLIYRKALRLSKASLGQATAGQVINLMSNDINRFDMACVTFNYLWIAPVQTGLALFLLWSFIGFSSVLGICVLLAFIPLQAWMGKKTSQLRMQTALKTDERVRLMDEIISGIQVIKMYAWEKPFANLVSQIRKSEISVIRGSSFLRGLWLSLVLFHTRIAIFLTILLYVLAGNVIDAEKVFVVASYFDVLKVAMTINFALSINQSAEAITSVRRIQKFLLINESNPPLLPPASKKTNGVLHEYKKKAKLMMQTLKSGQRVIAAPNEGITVTDATARWSDQVTDNTLREINFKVVPGKLTAIIGPVGSGKTSLLHALLGELPLSTGTVSISDSISYASQEPWLFAGSVRQNILFGSEYHQDRYRQVVKVCALMADLEQFPYGDQTVVGERGVALSGGQRARINLARAVYKESDVYLLDDPLSAVDTHVGKRLFEDCVTGYLRHKTVVLVTHQLQYLSDVDHIVVMNCGKIEDEGTYQQLHSKGTDFTKLLTSEEKGQIEEMTPLKKRRLTLQPAMSEASYVEDTISQVEPPEVAEMRSKGSINKTVYITYLTSGGNCCLVVFLLLMFVLTQVMISSGDYWLSYWVNFEEDLLKGRKQLKSSLPDLMSSSTQMTDSLLGVNLTRNVCIYVFSAIMFATVIITLFRSFMFFFMCMRSSQKLHDRMFDSITRATMYFFNTNSSGRILNRFSKDMGSIDEQLPASLIDCLQIGCCIIGIIVMVGVVNFWLVIPTFFISILFYRLRIYYLFTSRSVKRLEGVTRSPVFTHLNATLQGLTTIRAFHAEKILTREFDVHQDLHSSAWYMFLSSNQAFGLCLDMVCVIYIGLVIFSFLIGSGSYYGGNVGLAITQCIGLTGLFQWGIRQTAELENHMTSVERVLEYTDVQSEPPLESSPDRKPPDSWPDEGRITFSKVFLSYSANEPAVLKNLNFTVAPKEKVGIVGRTGAGKSSLIAALFRLANIEGEIEIDNIATSSIGLHDLRSKISIIPQEPVLFSGTIWENLDPFQQYQNKELWTALEEVKLKEVVQEMGGEEIFFSVGQRQLVCLARAILRNNKILVMDEATANVDPKTDALIQSTIQRKFSECTVLTIAHRLHTVMDSDKILVMSAGTVVEFDHPHLLLQNKEGVLFSMVEQTGRATRDLLHNIASTSYQKKHPNQASLPGKSGL